MSKHFAFVSLAAHGHVNPTLPLVEELVARGHRITYATGSDQAAAVRRAGATPVEMPWRVELAGLAGRGYTAENLIKMMDAGIEELVATFDELAGPFRADHPDCVCFDVMGLPGRALAAELGVPGVGLAPNMVGNEHFSLQRQMWPADLEHTDPRLIASGQKLAGFAHRRGLPLQALLPTAARAGLNLVFLPRKFQIAGETFGPEFRFLGPALPGRARPGDWSPPAANAPILLISLGTVFNDRPDLLRMCVEAFADTPWHVVMATGRADPPDPIPTNFEVHPQVPQLAVLRHASAFVSHTGMGSTMESLLHGVPLVSLPQTPEQAFNGRRAAELGLGRAVDPEAVTAAELHAAVEELVADQTVRDNLTSWRDELRGTDAAARGADALTEFLAGEPGSVAKGGVNV
ncbi:macrolide family glycosyltransferase [Saccharopolyspora sp. NPDC050389]|uniref:macrolide family glycosyltransferase n=1 Tax=Saccharopolyspora sp. NPDC050389 TaxID=3155516 RepID=UPI00340C5FA2